jgi:hypothetical protein
MSDLLVIYSILVTSLLIVYFDYNKCYRKEKKKEKDVDIDIDTEDENVNKGDILNLNNSFCSDKPIIAYGMTFNFNHRINSNKKCKDRSNTI